MKHVALDYHFICKQGQSGALRMTHVSSKDQLVDVLSKLFLYVRFLTQAKIGLFSQTSILWPHLLEKNKITSDLDSNILYHTLNSMSLCPPTYPFFVS